MTSYERFLSRDAANFRPSAIRAFAKLINDPNIISFAGGVPNPETFPAERIAEIASRVVRERRAISLQYGPTRGLTRLIESIARICRGRGMECAPSEVIVTTANWAIDQNHSEPGPKMADPSQLTRFTVSPSVALPLVWKIGSGRSANK